MEMTSEKPWRQWYQEKSLTLDLPECSIYELLENTARRFPEHTAVIFEDQKIVYRSLKSKIDRLAGSWKALGVKKGERIALMLANHPLYIVGYYAAQALGLTVIQVNPMYTPRELMQILVDSKPHYLVFDKLARRTVKEISGVYTFKQCFSSGEVWEGHETLSSLIERGRVIGTPEKVDPHQDIAVIQYTGGTSGTIKGAMLTHYNLTSNVAQGVEMYGDSLTPGEETVLAATPLYHVYGMTSAMNLGIYLGASILLFPKFEIRNVLNNIQTYRPTIFPAVPKMYNAFANYPDIGQFDLTCLKVCSCGSAPLPIEVINRFEQLTGALIGEGFGLSEASPSTHRNPPFAKRKVGSIGIPFPHTDCQIIDENGEELGPHCVGELLIKGPQIMKGYWNNVEESRKALRNGWLYTGDLAMMDKEGYFYIVGRKKEMIIVGGFNIYPQEVESVLYEHPDIQEAAVVSIPREESEETIKAFIVPKDGVAVDLEEIKGYCYSKLTPYKVPKEFEVIEELPRNTVGKLLKRLLVKEELEKKGGK